MINKAAMEFNRNHIKLLKDLVSAIHQKENNNINDVIYALGIAYGLAVKLSQDLENLYEHQEKTAAVWKED